MGTVQTPGYAVGGYAVYDSTGPGLGPTVVNDWTVLGHPAYWRAMAFIANNMASFPRFAAKSEVRTAHPVDRLLSRRPNGYQSGVMFWRTLFFHRSHHGNGYAWVQRDRRYRPVALHLLPPDGGTTPFRYADAKGVVSTYYHATGAVPGVPEIIPAADVLHLSALSWDGLAGLRPVGVHAEAMERARNVDRYMTRYLTKGTIIKGAIEIPADVDEAKAEKIVGMIRSRHSGPGGERDVIVLSGGAKLNNATLSAADTQLMQQAGYSVKQIAQITGVPPAFLFDLTEGKYNGSVEESYDMVVRDLFRPLIEQDESELSDKLLTDAERDAGWGIELDPNALIRGNVTAESSVAVSLTRAGVLTANEARQRLGMPKSADPEADKLKTSGDTSGGRPPGPQAPPADPAAPPTT